MPDHPASARTTRQERAQLLSSYLNDHLAGAVAGSHRMRRTADLLADTPVGPAVARVADEVAAEREEVRRLVEELGVVQARPKQVATWLGERVARLKVSTAAARRSPSAALLEVEVLRGAVVGKRGLWQTLTELAPTLGLDPVRCRELWEQTDRQVATLDEVHDYVRARVVRQVAR